MSYTDQAVGAMATGVSGIPASGALVEALAEFTSAGHDHGSAALLIVVNDDDTELVPREGGVLREKDAVGLGREVRGRVGGKEALYALIRMGNQEGYLFVTHIPEDAAIRSKMIYASTQGKVKMAVGLETIARDVRTDSVEELEEEIRRGAVEEEVEEGEEDEPLTEEERRLHRKNKVAHSAQNASYLEDRRDETESKTGGYLTVDAKVAEAARALPAGSMVVVVVTPGETLELGGDPTATTDVEAAIPSESGTCFVVARTARSAGDSLTLLLVCPDGATIRQRMVFSIATQSLQDALRSAGLDFESVSVAGAAEAASILGEGDGAGGGAAEASGDGRGGFSRPKRPGRGKRGLVRPKPASEA